MTLLAFMVRVATTTPSNVLPTLSTVAPPVDNRVNRSFDVQIYILEQANSAYTDQDSYEYLQALYIIRNAVSERAI